MKYLLLLVVVGIALFVLFGRGRKKVDPIEPAAPSAQPPATPAQPPAAMLACAHCGVHLPREDAVLDAAGRSFCGDAHRLAGPR